MLRCLLNEAEKIGYILLRLAQYRLILNSCNPVTSNGGCRCAHLNPSMSCRLKLYKFEDDLTIPFDSTSVNRQIYVIHFLRIATLAIASEHLFLFSNESIECSHSLFVHVITLAIPEESAALNIGQEAFHLVATTSHHYILLPASLH